MTPDKVEEWKKKVQYLPFWTCQKDIDQMNELIETILTQHHQDLMNEVLMKIARIPKTEFNMSDVMAAVSDHLPDRPINHERE